MCRFRHRGKLFSVSLIWGDPYFFQKQFITLIAVGTSRSERRPLKGFLSNFCPVLSLVPTYACLQNFDDDIVLKDRAREIEGKAIECLCFTCLIRWACERKWLIVVDFKFWYSVPFAGKQMTIFFILIKALMASSWKGLPTLPSIVQSFKPTQQSFHILSDYFTPTDPELFG